MLANIGAVSRADSAGALQVHPGQFAQALAALKAGRDIDYQGVGSVIDFDAHGDPTAGTYLILEAVQAADGSVSFVERKVISFP